MVEASRVTGAMPTLSPHAAGDSSQNKDCDAPGDQRWQHSTARKTRKRVLRPCLESSTPKPWPSSNYEAMQEVSSIQTCALGQFRQARRAGLVQAGPWCQSSPTPRPAFRGPEERTTPTPPGAPVWTVMSAAADLVLRYVGGVVRRAHLCYSLLFQFYLCQLFLITQRLVFWLLVLFLFQLALCPVA